MFDWSKIASLPENSMPSFAEDRLLDRDQRNKTSQPPVKNRSYLIRHIEKLILCILSSIYEQLVSEKLFQYTVCVILLMVRLTIEINETSEFQCMTSF